MEKKEKTITILFYTICVLLLGLFFGRLATIYSFENQAIVSINSTDLASSCKNGCIKMFNEVNGNFTGEQVGTDEHGQFDSCWFYCESEDYLNIWSGQVDGD